MSQSFSLRIARVEKVCWRVRGIGAAVGADIEGFCWDRQPAEVTNNCGKSGMSIFGSDVY